MTKITGFDMAQEVPAKVMLMYKAVAAMIAEGVDVNGISVSVITDRAGIGKGTVYEYFESKDELLVCAIAYYMQNICEKMSSGLAEKAGFAEKMSFIMDELDKEENQDCSIVRYVHILTDDSNLSRMVMQKMREEPLQNYLPGTVITKVLQDGIACGEVREDLPLEYMTCELLGKLLSYVICTNANGCMQLDREKIRPYLYRNILDELCKKINNLC